MLFPNTKTYQLSVNSMYSKKMSDPEADQASATCTKDIVFYFVLTW